MQLSLLLYTLDNLQLALLLLLGLFLVLGLPPVHTLALPQFLAWTLLVIVWVRSLGVLLPRVLVGGVLVEPFPARPLRRGAPRERVPSKVHRGAPVLRCGP